MLFLIPILLLICFAGFIGGRTVVNHFTTPALPAAPTMEQRAKKLWQIERELGYETSTWMGFTPPVEKMAAATSKWDMSGCYPIQLDTFKAEIGGMQPPVPIYGTPPGIDPSRIKQIITPEKIKPGIEYLNEPQVLCMGDLHGNGHIWYLDTKTGQEWYTET